MSAQICASSPTVHQSDTPAQAADTPHPDIRRGEEPVQALQAWTRLPADHPDRARRRDQLIRAFLPLAYRQACRYRNRGEDLQDLIQVATVALIGAIDRYDPDRGSGFYAYAVPTIRGELKRYFRDKGWMLQPPRPIQELRGRINQAWARLPQQLQRSPTIAELAEAVGAEVEQVGEALVAGQDYRPVSLNVPVSTDTGVSGAQLVDLIGGSDPRLDTAADRVSLPAALAGLSERDRTVITLRFFGQHTQAQIADRLGISQMQVSRLLARALAQMRAFLNGEQPPRPVTPRRRNTRPKGRGTAYRNTPTHPVGRRAA